MADDEQQAEEAQQQAEGVQQQVEGAPAEAKGASAEAEGAPAEAAQSNFAIHKIYVKDASLECPNSPKVFTGSWEPEVKFSMENLATDIGDSNFEVVIKATITVSSGGQVAYLIEVHQAGIFHLGGFPADRTEQWTATFCANILFPYVRETVSDLAVRAGFPQLLLSPINFDAVYAEQQQAKQAKAEA